MTTGTLTRKTEPHQKCSSSQPPVTGPMATPRPETPAQMPMALARSAGSVKTLVRIDRVAGMISAPPIPMNARAPMSALAEPLKAARTEPLPKMASPTARARRRPNLSPRAPAVSRRLANTRT